MGDTRSYSSPCTRQHHRQQFSHTRLMLMSAAWFMCAHKREIWRNAFYIYFARYCEKLKTISAHRVYECDELVERIEGAPLRFRPRTCPIFITKINVRISQRQTCPPTGWWTCARRLARCTAKTIASPISRLISAVDCSSIHIYIHSGVSLAKVNAATHQHQSTLNVKANCWAGELHATFWWVLPHFSIW